MTPYTRPSPQEGYRDEFDRRIVKQYQRKYKYPPEIASRLSRSLQLIRTDTDR